MTNVLDTLWSYLTSRGLPITGRMTTQVGLAHMDLA